MALMCVTGELGSGKTLTLTYLAWLNHYEKKKKIFSNYNLYGIPHTPIDALDKLNQMRDGFFAADEMWLWLDSRCSRTEKQTVTADILLKSRKRGLTFAFTSQTLGQVESRVRKVIDFVVYPLMNPGGTMCKVLIFMGSDPKNSGKPQQLYFLTEPVYRMYNTREEISPLREYSGEELKETLLPPRDLSKEEEMSM